MRVFSCNPESHIEWRYSTGVGEGGSSGVASSAIFKSTDSWRRSSINYCFRLFKLREDKKVGGIGGAQKRERAEPPTLLLIFSSVCIFYSNPKRNNGSIFPLLLSVTYDAKTSTSAERAPSPHPLASCCFLLTGEQNRRTDCARLWALQVTRASDDTFEALLRLN